MFTAPPSAAPPIVEAPVIDLPSTPVPEGTMARVRSELDARLRSTTPTYDLKAIQRNRLGERYIIRVDTPFPEFSRGSVKALGVADLSGNPLPLYAAICDNSLPYRHTSMEKLLAFEHDHLIKLESRGICHLSTPDEERHVLVFRRPNGKTLSHAIKEGFQFNEQRLTEQLLAPLASILTALEEMKLSHCHIHPDNMYLGERIVLGESISLPAGYAQDFLYEPIERLSALAQGKGGGTIKVDIYALGVLTVELLHGLGKLRGLSREQLTALLLTHGSYNVIAGSGEYSEHFQDFLRGTLSDTPAERWGPSQLTQWISGKRFNIIHPSTPRESSRAFQFEGKDYFNRKALAHAFFTNWDKARNFIRGAKLDRWLEQAIQEPDIGDLLQSAISTTGGPTSKSQKRNNELLARTLAIIDPSGPIRCEQIAFNVDALGKMLSDAIYHKKQGDLNVLIELIQSDLPHYWSERQNGNVTSEVQEALWKLQNIRISLMNPSFGFGVERALYDLNQDLPCYSQELKGFYIIDLPRLLRVLDALAIAKPQEFSLLDRHLAGFAACKAGINREIRFPEIAPYAPELVQNNELKVLTILARAQEKAGIANLKGLSFYAGLRLLQLVETIHSRRMRDSLALKIRQAAEDGRIGAVIACLIDPAALEHDQTGFSRAREMYQFNGSEISRLRDRAMLKKGAQARGKQWASFAAIVVLLLTGLIVIINHLG